MRYGWLRGVRKIGTYQKERRSVRNVVRVPYQSCAVGVSQAIADRRLVTFVRVLNQCAVVTPLAIFPHQVADDTILSR